MASFRDFTKRVENGEVNGEVKPSKSVDIEQHENGVNERLLKQYEGGRKESELIYTAVFIGIVLAVIFNLMTGMIIESVTLAIVISFLFGIAASHYS